MSELLANQLMDQNRSLKTEIKKLKTNNAQLRRELRRYREEYLKVLFKGNARPEPLTMDEHDLLRWLRDYGPHSAEQIAKIHGHPLGDILDDLSELYKRGLVKQAEGKVDGEYAFVKWSEERGVA